MCVSNSNSPSSASHVLGKQADRSIYSSSKGPEVSAQHPVTACNPSSRGSDMLPGLCNHVSLHAHPYLLQMHMYTCTHICTHTHTHACTCTQTHTLVYLKIKNRGRGFSSVVERLPSKRKALGSVPSSEKKKSKTLHIRHAYRRKTIKGKIPKH